MYFPFAPDVTYEIMARFGERGIWWKAYGWHTGLDIGVDHGTPITPIDFGRVVQSGDNGTFGDTVTIRHSWGYSLYAHASALLVKVGDEVAPGQAIALVGSSGVATGPHLHLEVHPDNADKSIGGGAVDPEPFINGGGYSPPIVTPPVVIVPVYPPVVGLGPTPTPPPITPPPAVIVPPEVVVSPWAYLQERPYLMIGLGVIAAVVLADAVSSESGSGSGSYGPAY